MIKLIASDMDGTLLGANVSISPENVAAIQFAREQGVQFMVATGRNYDEAVPSLQEAGIKCPLITVNGAQAFDEDGQELFTIDLHKEQVRQGMAFLEAADAYYELATTQGVFSNNQHYRIEMVATILSSHFPHLTAKMAIAMAGAQLQLQNVTFIESYDDLLARDDLKILKFFVSSNKGDAFLNALRAQMETIPDVVVTSSFSNNIEINHIDAQKGIAVKHMADRLGISLAEVMTIGDNFNDISMLKIAGVSFAMANAEAGVKQVARYEAGHHNESGVGYAIRRAIEENL